MKQIKYMSTYPTNILNIFNYNSTINICKL